MAKTGIELIRARTDLEEIDYSYVIDCLKDYRAPRAKITQLLKGGDLIRVKKGLYVFGEKWRHRMYSLEILANKIYGPSYISLEYALAYYGMIPEHVVEVTSVTSKRKRFYNTPVGRFSYTPIPLALYGVGFTFLEEQTALIATPEKALADLFYTKKIQLKTEEELKALLFEDLRLEESAVLKLNIEALVDIKEKGGSPLLSLLIHYLRSQK